MVVHCSTSGKLMAMHVNQLWSTEVGTRPRDNVTSAFMAPPTSIQPTSMKVRAPGHSVIYHIQLALWFSLSPMYSCCGPSPIASLPLLVTSLSLLFTSVTPLAWFSPPLPHIHCNPSTMPREHGKPKRGPLYYSFIARRSHPDPSQPSPPTNSPGRGQNWTETPPPSPHAQNLPPPLSENMHDTGSCPWKKKFLLLSCSPWKPHSSLASSPDPSPTYGARKLLGGGRNSPQLAGRVDCQEL
jgi:hypothetical protein